MLDTDFYTVIAGVVSDAIVIRFSSLFLVVFICFFVFLFFIVFFCIKLDM